MAWEDKDRGGGGTTRAGEGDSERETTAPPGRAESDHLEPDRTAPRPPEIYSELTNLGREPPAARGRWPIYGSDAPFEADWPTQRLEGPVRRRKKRQVEGGRKLCFGLQLRNCC